MYRLQRAAACLFALLTTSAYALTLGTVGPVYPIAEPHLLHEIERSLRAKERSGELARLESEAQQRVLQSIRAPQPVPGLQSTTLARSFYFDPSVTAPADITDAVGRILVRRGTRKNPLELVSLRQRLLFFRGDDERQVNTARTLLDSNPGGIKPILVAGSYLALMQRWRIPVYFDQQGTLTQRLGITHVPALVSQDGLRLRIDEFTP